jgi:hypothetical protein
MMLSHMILLPMLEIMEANQARFLMEEIPIAEPTPGP